MDGGESRCDCSLLTHSSSISTADVSSGKGDSLTSRGPTLLGRVGTVSLRNWYLYQLLHVCRSFQKYQKFLDDLVPYRIGRWIATFVFLLLYVIRVIYLQVIVGVSSLSYCPETEVNDIILCPLGL